VTCFVIAFGSYFSAGLTVEVGEASEQRILAPHAITNEWATALNREYALERAQALTPIRITAPDVLPRVMENISNFFQELTDIRELYVAEHLAYEAVKLAAEELRNTANTQQNNRPPGDDSGRLIVSPDGVDDEPEPVVFVTQTPEYFDQLSVRFTENQRRLILDMSDEEFEKFRDTVNIAVITVQSRVITEIDSITLTAVRNSTTRKRHGFVLNP
jgi:membrane-associated HD superfamily phosphohydrolase